MNVGTLTDYLHLMADVFELPELLRGRLLAILHSFRKRPPPPGLVRRWRRAFALLLPPPSFRTWFVRSRWTCGKDWCHCRTDGALHPTGHLVAWDMFEQKRRRLYVGDNPSPMVLHRARTTLYRRIRVGYEQLFPDDAA